ncbi:hypothetical protein GCM10027596_14360 [Nocardioides korecus]
MTDDPGTGAPPLRPRRRTQHGENRLPPTLAVVIALLLYALLPGSLLPTGRWLVPALEVLLLVVLVATNPRRLTRETAWSRTVSVALAAVVIATTLVSLGLLIRALGAPHQSGENLLLGAIQIWGTNVVGFALLYWEVDRGGPVARHREAREDLPPADWQFPQDDNHDTVAEVRKGSSRTAGWVPVFVDYLYLSLTNSSAFSPTDTMPLTSRAKLLMGLQGTAAMLTLLLVVARAVNSIG